MNTAIFNFSDFVKIGLMAFLFIVLMNWILRRAGLNQYQA